MKTYTLPPLLVMALALSACDSPQSAAPVAAPSETPAATASTAASAPVAAAEADIRRFLLQEYPDADKVMYALAWHDLNGDGADEAIIYLAGSYFCGTGGCNLLVLSPAGPSWRKVGDITVSRTPVTLLASTSNGWSDLTVDIAGGGGPSGTVVLRFDGNAYPGNASMAEQTGERGVELLPEAPVYATVEPERPAA